MHRELARAQVNTLHEWLEMWDRDGHASPGDGHGEVAFLLRRAAAMMARTVGLPYDKALAMTRQEEAEASGRALDLPPPTVMDDLRTG